MNITTLSYVAISIGCLCLLGFGYYLEYTQNLEPCPLCILQRIAYFNIALLALIAAMYRPKYWQHFIYRGLILMIASIGAGIAGRQIWLQYLPPDQVPECGPGLEYMLEVFPLTEALKMIFTGSGECAEVQWVFLGLSIPEWSLISFSLIIIVTLIMMLIPNSQK